MKIPLTIQVTTGTGEIRIYYQNKDYLVVDKNTHKQTIGHLVSKALQIEKLL